MVEDIEVVGAEVLLLDPALVEFAKGLYVKTGNGVKLEDSVDVSIFEVIFDDDVEVKIEIETGSVGVTDDGYSELEAEIENSMEEEDVGFGSGDCGTPHKDN